jgi:hypothetical protein
MAREAKQHVTLAPGAWRTLISLNAGQRPNHQRLVLVYTRQSIPRLLLL